MLSEMEQMNIYPNVVTVTLLVDGLANCNPPRSKEAKDLVQHLEFTARAKQKRYSQALNGSTDVSLSNTRIATALIRAYGRANDLDSAMEAFRRISTPDVIALNALLDACCRCSELKLALDTFKKYTSFEEWKNDAYVVGTGVGGEETRIRPIKPDVVTYTTLIAAVLQLKTKNASKRASMLYDEMKQVWRISPDTILVDR
jgi:pentatricopeptide repeat protein